MDDLTIHLQPFERRMPSMLPVQSIGYIAQKENWVRNRFDTFNFSFILSGGGTYRCEDIHARITAPCVITQSPGLDVEYGPSSDHGHWEELFIIYRQDVLPELQRRGLASPRRHYWHVRDSARMLGQVTDLMDTLQDPQLEHVADRADRACESLIVESRLGEYRATRSDAEERMHQIRRHMETHYKQSFNMELLSRQYGLSTSTFRRYWARYSGDPPGKFLTTLRMRDASRQLAETDRTVAEIATDLGYDDPLYFSRVFRKTTGMPATSYRKRYRIIA